MLRSRARASASWPSCRGRPSLEHGAAFRGRQLVIASHNPGKVREIAELLAPLRSIALRRRSRICPSRRRPARPSPPMRELKALRRGAMPALPRWPTIPGLSVDALDGVPGIFSGALGRAEEGFRLRHAAGRAPAGRDADRRAHFTCGAGPGLAGRPCRVLRRQGRMGRLLWPPRGERGFGYDPIFLPEGRSQTFGEMDPAGSISISHRAVAFRQLVAALLRVSDAVEPGDPRIRLRPLLHWPFCRAQLPLLRLQQPCARAHRPARWCRRCSAELDHWRP